MNNENYIYTPYAEGDFENEHKDFKKTFLRYLYHWPLFLVCLIISISFAFYYLKTVKPVYTVKAKLSIKDEKKSSVEKLALEELNISTAPKAIESEVEVLKSRQVIREVVNKLQLWVNYSQKDEYASIDLYSNTPFKFVMLKQRIRIPERTFEIEILSSDEFVLKQAEKEPVKASFKQNLRSSFGTWRLQPTGSLLDYVGKTIRININDPEKVVGQYQRSIVATLSKDAPVIQLSIEDVVPERGSAILNNLIASYKSFNILDKNTETKNTLKFIDERLASLSGELTDVEKDVEGYKSSVGLTDISSKSQFFLDNVQANDGRMNEVNVQLNVIEGIESYVNSASNSENVPATIGIADPGLTGLVEQLTKLQLQRDKLLAITPEGNPIFVPLNRQIQSTKTAIRENIKGIKSSLLATKRQLQKINSQFESSIKNLPGQERQYVSIKRQQGVKEGLYVYLLQQREQIGLSYASTLTDARTIDEAYYEDAYTRKGMPVGIALLFGFLVPVGLIYGREALRNRVMTRQDIEARTSAPIMCELMNGANQDQIVVLSRDSYAVGEQLRALRTNLLNAYHKKGTGKVTLFTSSISGEGKSFVASNIAASLAASGRKAIILELDLRKPKISKIFNLDNSGPGLSDLLNGHVSKEDIIHPSGIHPNLYVLQSGSVPSNPSELLETAEMVELLEDLRHEFDNIVIDTPPLKLVTDAMVIAPLVDVCLYLVRHNYTPKTELSFIEEVYRGRKLPNMNLVFNGIEMDGRYGYSVDYGYYSEKAPAQSLWNRLFGNFSARF